jgi:hypothetical protein
MDYLIIVCLHSGNYCMWLREGARRPAWWHQPELRAPFFVGRPCWRAPFSLMQLRVGLTDVPRGKVSGRARWESGLRDVGRRKESLCNGQYARPR